LHFLFAGKRQSVQRIHRPKLAQPTCTMARARKRHLEATSARDSNMAIHDTSRRIKIHQGASGYITLSHDLPQEDPLWDVFRLPVIAQRGCGRGWFCCDFTTHGLVISFLGLVELSLD